MLPLRHTVMRRISAQYRQIGLATRNTNGPKAGELENPRTSLLASESGLGVKSLDKNRDA